MNKIKTAVLGLLITTNLFAGAIDGFIEGLQKDYFFTKTDRARELHHHIRIAKFGPLGRILSPDAIATYNDRLNVISLDKDLVQKVGFETHIKDAQEIRGKDYKTYALSTIFHELAHAEMDVFIEEESQAEDSMLMSHYENTLRPFYKKHFPSLNPFLIFHEQFGYYRGEIIEFMDNELYKVMISNGFNKFKNSCFLTPFLRQKLRDAIALEDFQKFFVVGPEGDFYRKQINPQYVWVKGKDIDLYGPQGAKTVMDQTYQLFWAHNQAFYQFPINQKDLVDRMNKDSHYVKMLAKCRTKIWQDNRP